MTLGHELLRTPPFDMSQRGIFASPIPIIAPLMCLFTEKVKYRSEEGVLILQP